MTRAREAASLGESRKEEPMSLLMELIVGVFVLGVLALVAFTLYALSPFASHSDRYRDPATGKRASDSPRLD